MRETVKTITLRLDAKEYAHLKLLSQQTGLKLEPLVRKLILGENLRPRPPDEYAALLRELSAIGNNINQIAHTANGKQDITSGEVAEAVWLVHRAWRLVKETL